MSVEQNKALVRRFFEAHAGEADLDAFDEMLAPDFVSHTKIVPGQQPGREGYKQAIAETSAAFSNTRQFIEDQVAEGDKVVTRFVVHATHDRGEFLGVAPTGREAAYKAIAIHRISGGKIVEEWTLSTTDPELMGQRLEQAKHERERVEQELRMARDIQQALLPKNLPQLDGWEFSYHYQPARDVGGDFYDFFKLADGRLGFVVGDATGKGMPAALVMATTRSMVRAVARASDSPGEALRMANDPLVMDIPPNMFVTCFYAILDPSSGRLVYANAGHDVPYVRHSGGGAAEELRARGMPLGLMPRMNYEEKEVTLEVGDSALLYSDGLVEAHDSQREMFGFPRLRELVEEHTEKESLVGTLLEELHSFVGEGWEQEDDITLLTLRRSAASR